MSSLDAFDLFVWQRSAAEIVVLLRSPSADDRELAMLIISELWIAGDIVDLVARGLEEDELIVSAIDGLAGLRGHSRRFGARIAQLTVSATLPIRCRAIEALGEIGSKEHLSLITATLSDHDFRVRDAAVRSFFWLGAVPREAFGWLLSLISSDDPHVRSLAAMALSRVADDRAREIALPVLIHDASGEPDDDRRRYILFALREIGLPRAVSAAEAFAGQESFQTGRALSDPTRFDGLSESSVEAAARRDRARTSASYRRWNDRVNQVRTMLQSATLADRAIGTAAIAALRVFFERALEVAAALLDNRPETARRKAFSSDWDAYPDLTMTDRVLRFLCDLQTLARPAGAHVARLLTAGDSYDLVNAIGTLAAMEAVEYIPLIEESLFIVIPADDEEYWDIGHLYEITAHALFELGAATPRGIEGLVRNLKYDESEVRYWSAVALSVVGDEASKRAAESVLIDSLGYEELSLGETHAVSSLRRIGTSRALEAVNAFEQSGRRRPFQ